MCSSPCARSFSNDHKVIPHSDRAGTAGHLLGHFRGIAVSHAGNKVDDAHKRAMQGPAWVRGIVTEQVEDAAVFER